MILCNFLPVHQSSIIQVSTETQDVQTKPVQSSQSKVSSPSSPDPAPARNVTQSPADSEKCDNTDLELPEKNPEPTSTSTPLKKHPKPQTKFSSKQFFRVNKLFSEDKGMSFITCSCVSGQLLDYV